MRWMYINPDDIGTDDDGNETHPRATLLGCGWFPELPAGYENIATAPCVILDGAGQQIVLPDEGTLTYADVEEAAQPIIDAENAASDAPTTVPIHVDPDALTAAMQQLASATTVDGTKAAIQAIVGSMSPAQ